MAKIKSIIKNIVCFILYYSGLVQLVMTFILPKKKNLPVVILIYHRITRDIEKDINANLTINHPKSSFVKEMRFIKRCLNVISLEEAVDLVKRRKILDKPAIAITFDDGFRDNYTLARPILSGMDIPATVYLTTGYVGTNEVPWVEKLGQAILHTEEKNIRLNSDFNNKCFRLGSISEKRRTFDEIGSRLKEMDSSKRVAFVNEIIHKLNAASNGSLKMLNWPEIREMAEDNFTFGSHTITHPILSRMPIDEAKEEIRQSKAIIEKELGVPIDHFAYPNGRLEDFTDGLRSYCQELGFKSISTAVYGSNKPGSDEFALRRISPGENMHIFAFDLMRGYLRND